MFIFTSSMLSRYDNAAGRAAGTALAAVQKPFTAGLDWLGEQLAAAITDDALRAENEALATEVEQLENDLAQSRLDEAELSELRQLRSALGGGRRGGYTLKAASILAFEGSDVFNVFTVDVGADDGAERDTVVISGGGLVGRVLEANANSSKVVAIIDENNKVGFEIEGRSTEIGVCYGDGRGGIAGEMLDDQADVRLGDRVVTNGIGGIYPAGIVIGVIKTVEFEKDSSLLRVGIEPAVEFRSIKKVALLL
ncbi:MAG: rod shape-determining protein MreC [Clostridiales bacterium]|nr:rod shape-determining protein MreC [Clostridiales bacterium]